MAACVVKDQAVINVSDEKVNCFKVLIFYLFARLQSHNFLNKPVLVLTKGVLLFFQGQVE